MTFRPCVGQESCATSDQIATFLVENQLAILAKTSFIDNRAAREFDRDILQEEKVVLSKQSITNSSLTMADFQVSRNTLTQLRESEFIYGGQTEVEYLAIKEVANSWLPVPEELTNNQTATFMATISVSRSYRGTVWVQHDTFAFFAETGGLLLCLFLITFAIQR